MSTVARPVSLPVAPLTGALDAIVCPGNDARLALLVRRLIDRRTDSRVQDLQVAVTDDIVRLQGRCASFHVKQLAQHATMDLICGAQLINEIIVEA